MKKFIAAIVLLSGTLHAEDFASRLAAGHNTMDTTEGTSYHLSLVPFISHAIKSCVPTCTNSSKSHGEFRMVAYVDAAGHPNSVKVKPLTRVSRCFARSFASSQLPSPPLLTGDLYPVTVKMGVAP